MGSGGRLAGRQHPPNLSVLFGALGASSIRSPAACSPLSVPPNQANNHHHVQTRKSRQYLLSVDHLLTLSSILGRSCLRYCLRCCSAALCWPCWFCCPLPICCPRNCPSCLCPCCPSCSPCLCRSRRCCPCRSWTPRSPCLCSSPSETGCRGSHCRADC